ncbi:MAG: DUF4382 domain-containing protein [Candidatus Sulfotelmatobacter sp.]|jgi:hypothetical protein
MKKFFGFALLVALTMMGMSCGSSPSSSVSTGGGGGSNPQAAVFMTGEDAPLASVVSFNVTLNSVTLNGQDGTTATVISSSNPVTVDFARLIGLRSPLSFNSVKPDTYVSATFVMANPVVDYITLTPSPALSTLTGTFPSNQNPYTLTVMFPTSMVVSSNGLAGLKMEMDIRQSLATDGSGNLVITNNTVAVTPVIYIKATHATDPDGQVTDLTGGLVSASAANNNFVIQGPYGRQLTVDVNSDTQFNSGWSINNLATPAIIGVQGYFQADGTLLAQGVEVITTSHSFLSGRVLALGSDGSGGTNVTLWVGETGADMVSDIDTIMTIDVPQAVTDYEVCFFDNALTQFVFSGPSDLLVGQRIFIGGDYSNPTFTPTMISLRRQGVYGMLNTGSVTVSDGNAGVFTLANNGLVGYSTGGIVTVDTFNATVFINLTGLSQLQSETTAIPIEARGLFLKDPTTGNPTFYAGLVSTPPQSASK